MRMQRLIHSNIRHNGRAGGASRYAGKTAVVGIQAWIVGVGGKELLSGQRSHVRDSQCQRTRELLLDLEIYLVGVGEPGLWTGRLHGTSYWEDTTGKGERASARIISIWIGERYASQAGDV